MLVDEPAGITHFICSNGDKFLIVSNLIATLNALDQLALRIR
jgi:hypothetical protein